MSIHGTDGRGDRKTSGRTVDDPPESTCSLSTEQYGVLAALAGGRLRRDLLCGRLEPHLMDGRHVGWTLRALVIRGLVVMRPLGPARCTRRGADLPKSSD